MSESALKDEILVMEEAIAAARMILYKNNRKVYGLDD